MSAFTTDAFTYNGFMTGSLMGAGTIGNASMIYTAISSCHVRQLLAKTESEILNVAVDYTSRLSGTELMTGTPTVLEVGTTDLTIGNKAVNTGVVDTPTGTIAIGKAVVFTVSGGTAGSNYTINVQAATDATVAQTFNTHAVMRCLED